MSTSRDRVPGSPDTRPAAGEPETVATPADAPTLSPPAADATTAPGGPAGVLLSDDAGTVDLRAGAGTGGSLQGGGGSAAGVRIGPWQVVRELGRGGMGTVYLAERADHEFQQQVAIKLLRPGRDGASITRRFQAERQILASLDHPNVARLLDGGQTSDGHPYLVMEYIAGGEGIAAWCDARRLGVEARVALFLEVASAVQFAHQRLVVHRDIKPANVLVTPEGTPKLLDFGIAKLLDPKSLGLLDGEQTQADERLMTPAYASPEQVHGRPVTTASDVYALGVLLYELLTGRLPYPFRDFSLAEIVRVVGSQEADRPSVAVTRAEEVRGAGGELAPYRPDRAAQARGTTPDRLARRLRGDLDAIVARALRKEPELRYSSVDQMADDLRRWREGRPVRAHAGSLGYRFSRFVGRHRAGVAATALVVLAVAGGVVATVRQARIAERERERAERRFEEVRSLARAVVFEIHDAIADLPGSTSARRVLVERALRYLDGLAGEAAGDRGLQRELAQAYQRIGDVQGRPRSPNLGDSAGALASYRKAVGIWEALCARDPSPEDLRGLSDALSALGLVQAQGADAQAALATQRRAVATMEEALGASPGDAAARRHLAQLHLGLADELARAGELQAALASRRRTVALLDELWAAGARDDQLLDARGNAAMKLGNNLGNPAFTNAGDLQGAFSALQRAGVLIEELRARQRDRPSARATRLLAVQRSNLADVLAARGDEAGALARAREAIGLFRELADADASNVQAPLDVAISHTKIGEMLERAGRLREAQADYAAALAILEPLAARDPGNASVRQSIALMRLRHGFLRVAQGEVGGGMAEMGAGEALVAELVRIDPGNAEQRYVLAWAAWNVGDGWAKAAESVAGAARRQRWERARERYAAGLQGLRTLEAEGILAGSDLKELDEVAARLARAEAALRGSGPPS